MSISPAMTKALYHIVPLFLLVLLSSSAYAQFVAIRLEIPAGVQFSSQVMDPIEGGTWEKISDVSFHIVKKHPTKRGAYLAGAGGRISFVEL